MGASPSLPPKEAPQKEGWKTDDLQGAIVAVEGKIQPDSVPPATTTSSSAADSPAAAKKGPVLGKSGKKICCSCPETRKARDMCVLQNGELACKAEIFAHNECLRGEGFVIKE